MKPMYFIFLSLLFLLQSCQMPQPSDTNNQEESEYVTLQGRVVDVNGHPVVGAKVSTSLDDFVVRTDSQGNFYLETETVGDGKYAQTPFTLYVTADNYLPYEDTHIWGDHPTNLEIVIGGSSNADNSPYVTVTGQVVNQKGVPIVGAVVKTSLDSQTTVTDSAGQFHLVTNTIAGGNYTDTAYTVYVEASGYKTYQSRRFWGEHPRERITLQPLEIVSGSGPISDALIAPNGGEHWFDGSQEQVQWQKSQLSGSTVSLYILYDSADFQSYSPEEINPKNWYLFAHDVPNTGSYTLDPADLHGNGSYRILIVSDEDSSQYDVSDGDFTLN